jgi:hypothetical protein
MGGDDIIDLMGGEVTDRAEDRDKAEIIKIIIMVIIIIMNCRGVKIGLAYQRAVTACSSRLTRLSLFLVPSLILLRPLRPGAPPPFLPLPLSPRHQSWHPSLVAKSQ